MVHTRVIVKSSEQDMPLLPIWNGDMVVLPTSGDVLHLRVGDSVEEVTVSVLSRHFNTGVGWLDHVSLIVGEPEGYGPWETHKREMRGEGS